MRDEPARDAIERVTGRPVDTETARDAVAVYLMRAAIPESVAIRWTTDLLATLGIPPTTPLPLVTAAAYSDAIDALADAAARVAAFVDDHEEDIARLAPDAGESGASPEAAPFAAPAVSASDGRPSVSGPTRVPLSADTRTRAIEATSVLALPGVAMIGSREVRIVRDATVDALVAAGLLRAPHDDAAIERAARALYEHVKAIYDPKGPSWEATTMKPEWIAEARVALAAAEESDDA